MTRKFEGLSEAHPYYVLEPVYQGGILYVPADNPQIFLREVISEQEANALIDAIPEMEGEEFHSRSVQELSAHYEQAMQSHDCKDLAALAGPFERQNAPHGVPESAAPCGALFLKNQTR